MKLLTRKVRCDSMIPLSEHVEQAPLYVLTDSSLGGGRSLKGSSVAPTGD
jgi:hypothetical protein